MSNKTDLQALNTQYESLIQTLSGKAAGGGSGESKMMCVTGIIETTSGTKPNGTVIASVTGLGFAPIHVVIWPTSPVQSSSTSHYMLGMVQGGLLDCRITGEKVSTTISRVSRYATNLVNLTINEDGFVLKSTDGNVTTSSYYQYLAFGADSYTFINKPSDDSPEEEEIPGL